MSNDPNTHAPIAPAEAKGDGDELKSIANDIALLRERGTPLSRELALIELRIRSAAEAANTPQPADGEAVAFQARVADWMGQCFIPSLYSNMTERGDRMLEEVLELLQATGYDRSRVATLVDYVYSRPAGEPAQEVGGVMVTLAGFCWIAGLDMHADGERELARICQPEVMAKIRRKQEAKNALRFDTPLPGQDTTPPAAPERAHRPSAEWYRHRITECLDVEEPMAGPPAAQVQKVVQAAIVEIRCVKCGEPTCVWQDESAPCVSCGTENNAPVQAAPQEGEDAAEAYRKAWEAGHAAACELVVDDAMVERVCRNHFPDWDMYGPAGKMVRSADIRRLLTAALQHHGDSRGAAGALPAWIATWMADREILPDDDGDGISEGALVEALNNHERELLNAHHSACELGAVRIDDAMIQRGCDAYSAKRMEETGEGESYPEGMQAALTAALQHRGDSRGGEGS